MSKKENGLKKTIKIRLAKITPLEKDLVLGRLGKWSKETLNEVEEKI